MRRFLFLLASLTAFAAPAAAADFPARPVTIVVPYSPGGLTDNIARLYADALGQRWGQPVVVENKPGGGASIGAAAVARAPADGYTLLVGSVGMVTNPYMLKQMPYEPASLAPLARVALAPNVLYVHPSVPARNVGELVDFARAHPGKLSFASSGVGSSPHLAAELFAAKAGIEVIQVPYKGTGAAMTDFLGGQVNAYFDTMQSMPYAREGKIRALAVATAQRLDDLPGLPTVNESGRVADVVSSSWFGFYLPAATPGDLRARLAEAILAVSETAAVKDKIKGLGLIGAPQGPAAFAQFNREEEARWREIIERQRIGAD